MVLLRHFKTVFVLILSSAFIYVGLLNLLDRREWRQPTDRIRWTQTDQGVEIRSLEAPRVVDSADNLSQGDRLVSINGSQILSLNDHAEVLELLAHTLPPGIAATYLVEKAGSGIQLSYAVPIELVPVTDLTDFLLALVACTQLGIGLFIFVAHWKAQGAFHFYLICLFAFVLYLYRYSGRADLFDLLIYWCSATVFLMLPPLFLHFCCNFPQSLSLFRSTPSLRTVLYVPATFLLGIHIAWFSGALQQMGFPRNHSFQLFFDRLHLAHFVFFFLLASLTLAWSRYQIPSPIQRLQVKWLALGTLAGTLPFVGFYALPFLVGLPISPYMEVSVLALILIPLSFGYAIAKHRLVDVELIFKQGAAYVLASSALLGLYVGIVLLIGRAIQGFSPESGFALFTLSALLVAFLFAPLRNKIQNQIDRYFYREEYDYRQSLSEFGATLASEIRLTPLVEKISLRVRKTLNVAPVAVFLRNNPQDNSYQLYHIQDPQSDQDKPGSIAIPEAVFSDFDRALKPLFLLPPSELIDRVKQELLNWQLHYVQPLRVHGRVIGFLGLGKRLSGDLLSSEDLDLVGTLAGYASIALDNALLYLSLESKAHQLTQLKVYSDSVVESITLGVLVVTPEGKVKVWNNTMDTICGLSRSEVLGKNIEEVFAPELLRSMRRLVEGPRWIVENTSRLQKTHLQSKDGHTRLVNITFSPFVSQDDIVTDTLLVFDDITEKVRLENQLMQAEKLTSIGLLTAGIAHEVNTPLTGISSYVQMLLKEATPDAPSYSLLKKIESQSFRAASIVNNLLNFARVSETDFEVVNLNTLMLETLSLLDPQLRNSSIDVKLDLDPSLPGTLANGGKLQQVLMNLLLNARDAMPQGGELRLTTYKENSQLVVEIGDSGTGISVENIKKIYDPFFTTKEVGKGSGLGLSVCYGIIQEHSGRISVESQQDIGTTFCLRLPVERVS
jgi:PAS domain S-box-containing protein